MCKVRFHENEIIVAGSDRAGVAKRPIVWLAGVRRIGKTTFRQMLPGAV
jgi:predicted AAA+ superfamily ATPase